MGVLGAEYLTPEVAYGKPRKTAKNIAMFGDHIRATFIDSSVQFVAVSVLYDMTFMQGNPNRSWSGGDLLLVALVTWVITRTGIVRRWS